MTAQPLVYVILVNWNGRGLTLECLESLSALTYANAHMIVVDNASTDGSADAIKSRFPSTTVLQMDRNLRFAGGNNVGIRYALDKGAAHVLLLNNDTTVAPDVLTHLVYRIESDVSIGMVAPKILYHSTPDRLWFAGGTISMWTGTMMHIGIREHDSGQHDTSKEIDYATGCCILVRAKAIQEVGLLDESYFMYTEDADWSMRFRRAGYSIVYEPAGRVWHKISVSSGGHLSLFKLKHKFFSNLRFFSRYASWYHWLVWPWLNVLVNIGSTLRYLSGRMVSGSRT